MNIKRIGLLSGSGVILILVGVAIGFHIRPYRLKLWKEVVTVEKIVKEEVTKKDVKTTITKNIDGTEVTVIEDKTTIDSTTSKDSATKSKESKTIENKKNDWHIAIDGRVKPFEGNFLSPTYGASIDRRVLGPFWLGIYGSTDKSFGARLGMSF